MTQSTFLSISPYSMENITIFSLENFLKNKFSISDFMKAISTEHNAGNIQFAVEISDPVDVERSYDIPAQSFQKHHELATKYLSDAKSYLSKNHDTDWVAPLIHDALIKQIGPPPPVSHPIYFISSENDTAKKVVYVGRTSADNGRFDGGHKAISKLHSPTYQGEKKKVYMASVLVRITDTEWVNLELINPRERAEWYLSDIELNLIFGLQPELNEQGKTSLTARLEHLIHVVDPHTMVQERKLILCYESRAPDNKK